MVSDKSKGILYVITAAFGFSGMSLFVKLAGDLPAFQKAFFRNFIALIFMTVLIIKTKTDLYRTAAVSQQFWAEAFAAQ